MNNFKQLESIIKKEKNRQKNGINLIASENIVPEEILNFTNNCFSNKYAEGKSGKRFYSGCEFADELEEYTKKLCLDLFGGESANVQPHSGVQANLAVYLSCLKEGDTILSMNFSAGGHLSHGHLLSIVSKLYKIETYNVDFVELIDYIEVLDVARRVKPKLIIAGASSYSREINYEKFSLIAKEVGAFLLIDIAHIAGLIASGCLSNPIKYADFVTSTTHKTLRGIRGGFIISKKEFEEKINRAIMPGVQGGPHMNMICGKAATFIAAKENSFKEYSKQIILNSQIMSDFFIKKGLKVISNGTDNHLFVLDCIKSFNKNGYECEKILENNNIYVNRNSIPYDKLSPIISSGIRIGTPFITSQNLQEKDCIKIAKKIINLLS